MSQLEKRFIVLSRHIVIRFGLAGILISSIESLTAIFPHVAVLHHLAGRIKRLNKDIHGSLVALEKAVQIKPNSRRYVGQFVKTVQKEGRIWRDVEALERAAHHHPNDASFHLQLGNARDRMNRYAEAAQAYQRANALSPGNPWWLYREGYAWERAGNPSMADTLYERAKTADSKLESGSLGIGIFHEKRGLWTAAAQAYAREAASGNDCPALLYRLGLALEHCGRWSDAEIRYRQAVAAAGQNAEWWYRLGFVCEQQQSWSKAAEAYQHAVVQKQEAVQPSWRYRLGYVLSANNQFEAACGAFPNTCEPSDESESRSAMAIRPDLQDLIATNFYQRGLKAEARSDWSEAAEAYGAAVHRRNKHSGYWYHRLGQALAKAGRFEEAAHAYCQTRQLQRLQNQPSAAQRKRRGLMQTLHFVEAMETLPLVPHTVLYESYAGKSVGCNPYAIYQAIVDDPAFAGWQHVWVLNDASRAPADCVNRDNVIFVKRDSDLYIRYLATAKWLINNVTFPYYYLRREGQQYLNTWHGTPLKTLGKDIRSSFMEHKNAARNLLHVTHLASPNAHTSQVLVRGNDLDGIVQAKLAETGHARNDLILNATGEQRRYFRQKLGLAEDATKPLVLYAPTWRGALGQQTMDTQRLARDLKLLGQMDCQLVFRGHSLLESMLNKQQLDVLAAPQALDTSELLAITDVLITDYSSIFFDFLPTGRPILFYTWDEDEYRRERGLYFDMATMPGPNCASIEQLEAALRHTLTQLRQAQWQPDDLYLQAQQRFCPHEDGQAAGRVIDFFFHDSPEFIVPQAPDARKALLFYVGSFMPNGIATAALNLLHAIDPKRYRIVLVIDPASVGRDPKRLDKFAQLPEHVQVIARVGQHSCTAHERALVDRFYRHNELDESLWPMVERSFAREFRRMFGTWQPDHVLEYGGFTPFWAMLLSCGVEQKDNRKIIYIHSNMYGEWKTRFPTLKGVFNTYKYYDRLVSVSKSVSELNSHNLSDLFNLDQDKFVHADNLPDIGGVAVKALEPLEDDLKEFIEKTPAHEIFVTLGRLSPEKNHELMLDAFAIVHQKYPKAKLLILGDGPLHAALDRQIIKLGLNGAAWLAGQRSNPFPLLKASGCFVLSSRYEGQPMTLLEAMALNKPIVATDIAGSRDLLQACDYGTLVEEDAGSMAEAMMQIIENPRQVENTSAILEAYRESALAQFYAVLQ